MEVLCLPLLVVREIRGHEARHLGYGYRELLHLRAVIDFEVRAGFQPLHALLAFALVVGQRFDRAVGDVEVFEFLQVADLRGQRFEAVAEFAVRGVQRADVALAARRRFEYLILGVALIVKLRGADVDVVFAQREGARPRHLLRRMQQVQVFLVILEPVARALRDTLVRVQRRVFETLRHVVVRAEVQLHELRELADLLGHVAVESEAAEVDFGHASVGVDLDAGLVAPQVRILVEVPVRTDGVVLSLIGPFLAVQRFPDGIEGIVILHVLVCFVERYGHVGFGRAVVFDGEGRFDRTVVRLEQDAVAVVGQVSEHDVVAGGQREERVAGAGRGLVSGRGFRVLFVVEVDREGDGQLLERHQVVGLGVLHRDVELPDLFEDVLARNVAAGPGGRGESRHVLGQREAHRAAREDVHRQVVRRETARHDRQAGVGGVAVVELLVVAVEERETGDFVFAGQQFELVAAHPVFGALLVGRRKGEGLDDGLLAAGEGHLHLAGFGEVVELRFDGPGPGRPERVRLRLVRSGGVVGRLLV